MANHPLNPQARARRALQATSCIVLVLAALGGAFYQTQVVRHRQYLLRSAHNRVRPVSIPAPRGRVYDRNGELITDSLLLAPYAARLAGIPGTRYEETDSAGRVLGPFAPGDELPPIPGRDLRLTLDLRAQQLIRDSFPDAEAAVVLQAGEVIALHGAVHDPVPPGRAWLPVMARLALDEGLVTLEARVPIRCSGGMEYQGRYVRCSKTDGHGSLTLREALAEGCSVYFYQLGIWLGKRRLQEAGTRLGFSPPTGTGPDDLLAYSVGEGSNLQTPLQLARHYDADRATAAGSALFAGSSGELTLVLVADDAANAGPHLLRSLGSLLPSGMYQ